ncbi:MAG: hypothetical protein A2075_03200 [Geobacteraceae bacterium GWC2_58_44]|nr:MAG: hypothetical protein A2075_03200 [Geobacteraceae bacterium GWC2_58_44]HBG05835.1 hypothetical protein [Geobacter sp.]
MIKTVQKLLDRNFVVGYFIPACFFVFCNAMILHQLYYWEFNKEEALSDASLFSLVSWLFGVLLSICNWRVIRTLEGYGSFNPLGVFRFFHVWNYKRHKKKLESLTLELSNYSDKDRLRALKHKLSMRKVYLADHYPNNPLWIKGTGFGNTIRAFEVYPKIMYGAESIYIWDRMVAVISKEFMEIINESKSRVDFWVNVLFLLIILAAEVLILDMSDTMKMPWWLYLVFLLLFLLGSKGAKDSAREWGVSIKSAFDIYLPVLYKKLNFQTPATKSEEWQNWHDFSTAISHKDPLLIPKKKFEA